MTAETRVRYRKLPGHRRGIVRSSSVWMGPDHFLLVRNMRFREEYKRYHLRDIQAIAIAKCARFHVSWRSVSVALLWLIAFVATGRGIPSSGDSTARIVVWSIAPLLIAAWVYVSAWCSCRCRIYTAVSKDELPSVYRTWTARKFLARVEPMILEQQGVLQGDWAEAIESLPIGPVQSAAPTAATPAPVAVSARTRNWVTDAFIAVLFLAAILDSVSLRSRFAAGSMLFLGVSLLEVGFASAVIVLHHRRTLRAPMQKFAIATLTVLGILFYVRPLLVGINAGIHANVRSPQVYDVAAMLQSPLYRQVNAGIALVLALTGLAICVFSRDDT